jgi:hypothetical protein
MPLGTKKPKYIVKGHTKVVEEEKKKERTMEDKFYWIRLISALVGAILGTTVFHFVGWIHLIWMVSIWFGFPWIINFAILRIPYVKDKWDWKHILKTGIGAYFFFYMLIATILHTIIVMNDPSLGYSDIFAHPATTP